MHSLCLDWKHVQGMLKKKKKTTQKKKKLQKLPDSSDECEESLQQRRWSRSNLSPSMMKINPLFEGIRSKPRDYNRCTSI